MKLPSDIRFVDEITRNAFYKIEKGNDSEKKLFKTITIALNKIEENAFCGIQIPKRLIPKEYVAKYEIKNLWKYNLSNGWRLMYSIVTSEVLIISLVLEWFDHKDYEKTFKY